MNSSSALIFLFVLISLTGLAQDTKLPAYDSSRIDIRQIDASSIEELKADPEMDYGQSPAVMSLWERFKIWFRNFISSLFRAVEAISWVRTVLIVMAILLMAYVILRLLNVNALNMMYSGGKKNLPYGLLEEDIHSMDFDGLIRNALEKKEFRLAIRLLFLKALKLLADHHHIAWQPGKTNHDYIEEVKAQSLRIGFNELNFYFEYAWYGNFAINESVYRKAESVFEEWKQNM